MNKNRNNRSNNKCSGGASINLPGPRTKTGAKCCIQPNGVVDAGGDMSKASCSTMGGIPGVVKSVDSTLMCCPKKQ